MANSKSVGLLATVLLLPATPTLAQSADELPQIVVTGIRQAYRGDFTLKETPQAVAVIDAGTLQVNNIMRLTDALDLNASVARQNNFGGLWDAFAVRGFAGDENLPSGYLVNGFNGGRGFGGARDAAGVERIEVLKGPSAALFGRGEPGGTINIVTKRAEFGATEGSASASFGSFARARGDADVNLAIGARSALRLVGYYEDADSFRDTISSSRYGFLPSFGFRLGPDTTLAYDLELTRQEVPFDRGIVTINGRLDAIPRNRFLGEPGDGPVRAEATGHQLQLQHAFDGNWNFLLGANYRETSLSGSSTEAELARARQKLFVDSRSLSRQRRSRDYDAEHLALRGELSGDFTLGTLRNRVLIGADFDRFENSQVFLRFRPPNVTGTLSELSGNVIDVVNPVYGRFALPSPGPLTDRLDRQRAYGVYFQDQITLSERLQVRIGGRYDSFELHSLNRATGVAQERPAGRFSPQAGLVFEASEAVSLYVAYGQGFRSNIGADVAGRIFDPEISKSFEFGAKLALFDSALTGTVSAFELGKSNVLAADPGNPGFSIPIGKARSRGLEVDLNGRLPGAVDLQLSYAYIDAQANSNVLDPNFSLSIRVGDRLINIPKHSLNAQLSRAFAVGSSTVRLGAGIQHVGERMGETATAFILPDYTLGRLFASWTITEHIDLTGEIKNLFDATYYTNSFSSLWVQPGSPRSGSVGICVRF
jgi:iron complex outermembrane receptor protein